MLNSVKKALNSVYLGLGPFMHEIFLYVKIASILLHS